LPYQRLAGFAQVAARKCRQDCVPPTGRPIVHASCKRRSKIYQCNPISYGNLRRRKERAPGLAVCSRTRLPNSSLTENRFWGDATNAGPELGLQIDGSVRGRARPPPGAISPVANAPQRHFVLKPSTWWTALGDGQFLSSRDDGSSANQHPGAERPQDHVKIKEQGDYRSVPIFRRTTWFPASNVLEHDCFGSRRSIGTTDYPLIEKPVQSHHLDPCTGE